MKKIVFLILIAACIACKNDNEGPVKNNGLVGKWKLVQIYWDPGDGPGEFRTIQEHASSVLEFRRNGDFSEKKGIIYSSINPFDTYTLLDSNKIEFSARKNPSITYKGVWTIHSVTQDTLVLGYECDEPCKGKYAAIR